MHNTWSSDEKVPKKVLKSAKKKGSKSTENPSSWEPINLNFWGGTAVYTIHLDAAHVKEPFKFRID